jgi:hypothetical protein
MSKYNPLFYFFTIVITILGCKSKPPQQTAKVETKIVVNGLDDEWQNKYSYDKISKFQYVVARDEQNLYLVTKVQDESLRKKILLYGLTTWIDTTGKSKEKIGIRYPIGILSEGKNSGSYQPIKKENEKEMNELFMKNSFQLQIRGFKGLEDYGKEFLKISSKTQNGINAAYTIDTLGTFIYEIQIPFAYLRDSKVGSSVMKNYSITFRTGSISGLNESDFGPNASQRTQGGSMLNGNGMGGRTKPMGLTDKEIQEMIYMGDPTEVKVNIGL